MKKVQFFVDDAGLIALQATTAESRQEYSKLKELLHEARAARGQNRSECVELTRQVETVEQRKNRLDHALAHAAVRPARPETAEFVDLGTRVTIQRLDENDEPLSPPEDYLVAGYEGTDTKTSPPTLSYTSPLIDPFFGKRVDPDREPALLKEGVYLELLHISLPPVLVTVDTESEAA